MTDPTFEIPRFGTDGIRGLAGSPPLDADTMRRIGASLGLWLQRAGPETKRVVVGNDGRDSSMWILEALAQGLAAAEVATVDIGLTSTPALSFLTRTENFVAGVMISASHNPATDNGIKIFSSDGTKLPTDAETEIEELTPTIEFEDRPSPNIREESKLLNRYEEHLANTFMSLDLSGATIVIDAANGGAADLGPAVLRGLGADVVAVACEPDGYNINDGVGALHPDNIRDTVIASGAVLGICLDGDADRGIFVDSSGKVRDGDDILATLGPDLKKRGALPDDTVVATVMSNLGMKKALQAAGINIAVTPVGDRHVTSLMREKGYALGAEQSGHVAFSGPGQFTGDGLYTALQLLSMPGMLEKGSAALFCDFAPYPQLLVNVKVSHKPDLENIEPIRRVRDEIATELGDDGRVLLRYSGTENLCRVMIEGPTTEIVRKHAEHLALIVKAELNG